jgi:hypothetical protein
MATEMVVKEALSSEMISAGEELTRRLDEARFIVTASLWLYITEANDWRFIIGSPEVRTNGPKKAYKRIQNVIAKMSEDQPKIQLRDVTVIDSNDPLISLLRVAVGTGEGVSNIRFRHNVINGVLIEDAYIYRIS